MSKYKALALDIDGTLLNSRKEVTPAVLKQIQRMQKAGIPVMIASGRPEQGIAHVAEEIGMKQSGGYVLSFNGGKITEFKTGEVVYNKTVPEEYNARVIRYAKDIPESAILTYQDGCIITENPEHPYVQLESRVVKMAVKRVENLEKRVQFPVNKFLIVGNPEILQKKVTEMAEAFHGKLNIFQSEPFFIEVVPLGIDKAESLDVLLHTIGVKQEELVACGDGRNDVTMIRYAGMGVAMENACDEVKQVADYMADSCDNDGVAKIIEKFWS